LGINYTIFWDEDASSQLEDAFGEKFSMDVDNTWGIAGRAGFDYMITDNILFNASVWYINMETEAKFKGKSSGTRIKAKSVDIDPWVYTIGVGYRF
jgi:outer membrane protein